MGNAMVLYELQQSMSDTHQQAMVEVGTQGIKEQTAAVSEQLQARVNEAVDNIFGQGPPPPRPVEHSSVVRSKLATPRSQLLGLYLTFFSSLVFLALSLASPAACVQFTDEEMLKPSKCRNSTYANAARLENFCWISCDDWTRLFINVGFLVATLLQLLVVIIDPAFEKQKIDFCGKTLPCFHLGRWFSFSVNCSLPLSGQIRNLVEGVMNAPFQERVLRNLEQWDVQKFNRAPSTIIFSQVSMLVNIFVFAEMLTYLILPAVVTFLGWNSAWFKCDDIESSEVIRRASFQGKQTTGSFISALGVFLAILCQKRAKWNTLISVSVPEGARSWADEKGKNIRAVNEIRKNNPVLDRYGWDQEDVIECKCWRTCWFGQEDGGPVGLDRKIEDALGQNQEDVIELETPRPARSAQKNDWITCNEASIGIMWLGCVFLSQASRACWTCVTGVHVHSENILIPSDFRDEISLLGTCGRAHLAGYFSSLAFWPLALSIVVNGIAWKAGKEIMKQDVLEIPLMPEEARSDDSKDSACFVWVYKKEKTKIRARQNEHSGNFRIDDLGDGVLHGEDMTITWPNGRVTKTIWPNTGWFENVVVSKWKYPGKEDSPAPTLEERERFQKSQVRLYNVKIKSDSVAQEDIKGLPHNYGVPCKCIQFMDHERQTKTQIVPKSFLPGHYIGLNCGKLRSWKILRQGAPLAAVCLVAFEMLNFVVFFGPDLHTQHNVLVGHYSNQLDDSHSRSSFKFSWGHGPYISLMGLCCALLGGFFVFLIGRLEQRA